MIKIEADNVSLAYGHNVVIKDLTFQVSPGEMVGLIGPNGSGKSTVIKALSHIMKPYSGNIFMDGRNLLQIPRGELARMLGVVPQMPLLPSSFTAFEIVLMGRNPHLGLFQYEGVKDMEITWQAMGRTATQALAERSIGELSGGEIQRIVIARVLAQEPKSILLDEPTSNLDINHQVEILDLIKALCLDSNLAVVITLHDLNLASQYCDRLILINNGEVHAQGTPTEVINTKNIKEVYGADNCVYTHPANGLPTVLLEAGTGQNSGYGNARNGQKSENNPGQ
ncbi:heme ABC transporter ATP-binding protein [Chloroflexota bacterium]